MDEKSNDSHRLILERRKKLKTLKDSGNNYLNNYLGKNDCAEIIKTSESSNVIDDQEKNFTAMGRMMSKRIMGKSSFANIKDNTGNIQFYIDKKNFSDEDFKVFKDSDIGDIICITGHLFSVSVLMLFSKFIFYLCCVNRRYL